MSLDLGRPVEKGSHGRFEVVLASPGRLGLSVIDHGKQE